MLFRSRLLGDNGDDGGPDDAGDEPGRPERRAALGQEAGGPTDDAAPEGGDES